MSGYTFTLVGLVSTYKEGTLATGAIRSLLPAVDHVFVLDGPAGEPLPGEVAETILPRDIELRVELHFGRWRSDARKRQALLDWVKQQIPGSPLWGLILDGDEVLCNGEYLCDWLQVLEWEEEQGAEPYLGRPIRLVEMNGAVGWMRGRLLRLDRVKQYHVSTSVFENEHGVLHGEGNQPDSLTKICRDRQVAFESGLDADGKLRVVPIYEDSQVFVGPPMPGEPYILHRPLLRHPLRRGHRLHEQERSELEKAGWKP